jgi:hypothetical protein
MQCSERNKASPEQTEKSNITGAAKKSKFVFHNTCHTGDFALAGVREFKFHTQSPHKSKIIYTLRG